MGRGRRGAKQDNLLTNLVLVFPLLLFYEVGVLFSQVMNGADLITQTLLHLVGLQGYLGIQAGLFCVYLGVVLYLRNKQNFHLDLVVPVVLESGIYALTMGTLIIFLMEDLIGLDPRLAAGASPLEQASLFQRVVMAAGAGVHEELLFRLILLNGLLLFFNRGVGLGRGLSMALAVVVSSLLFSAAHHAGPLGEPLKIGVFTYRALAGLFFAALYQFRSFAVAVYTHTLYDLYVFLLA